MPDKSKEQGENYSDCISVHRWVRVCLWIDLLLVIGAVHMMALTHMAIGAAAAAFALNPSPVAMVLAVLGSQGRI